jgi:hypothetical protein
MPWESGLPALRELSEARRNGFGPGDARQAPPPERASPGPVAPDSELSAEREEPACAQPKGAQTDTPSKVACRFRAWRAAPL